MGGMSHPLQVNSPLVISAFHTTVLHQLLLVLAVGLALGVIWNVTFAIQQRRAAHAGAPEAGAAQPEPTARRFLRIAFGLLWVLDGLLQLQSAMPLGMPAGVVEPAASGSPSWVHALVDAGVTIWSDHPVEAAASVVWIQLGIGLALLLAPRGRWSRAAGGVSVGWALVVWSFGEAFGGLFAPGLSWMTGAPGAVLFYAAAGGLVALPEPAWRGPRLGRMVTGCLGLFFVGMAVLQAWPGRGTWQGGSGRSAGNLVTMVRTMAKTDQPHLLSGWLTAFGSFDAAHGWGVNLFLVIVLGAIGVALCSGWRPIVLPAAAAAAVVCLADWVLVQDLGFLGGVGTDPNSMVPMVLLLTGGVVALLRAPVVVGSPAFVSVREVATMAPSRRWDVLTPGVLGRAAAGLVALAVVLVGAVPMAAASANPNVDPIVTEAVNGTPDLVNTPAPAFSLVDQLGRPVSLADLRGKAIALTFLDPVCTTDCPLIAQSFRQADQMLGADADKAEFVAIVANPIYRSVAAVRAFDHEEGMGGLHNWLYLTGSLQALTRVWNRYGIQVAISPAGAMVDHSEIAYVIDGAGRMRAVLDANPGTTRASHASMSTLVADQLRAVLGA